MKDGVYMSKEDLINKINEICDFIVNGEVIVNGQTFNGHPNFYLIHSKNDFQKKLNEVIIDKNFYDRFDLFYYTNLLFKYMLDQYDSHTVIRFCDNIFLPIKIKIFDGIPYIVDGNKDYKSFIGSKIVKINDFDIEKIISLLKNIICYASVEYLKIMLESYLTNANIIQSLPFMKKSNIFKITTNDGEFIFDITTVDKYKDKKYKPNYNLEIIDETAIITYSSCNEEEKMINLINILKDNNQIENYIVDLRGNNGGNSSINKHLVEFLKEKKVIVLCDERVFSSARMCLIDLKRNGATIIGASPGTPISCFGNCVMQKKIDEMNLKVMGSATYWYYDENYKCHGIRKENWDSAIKQRPDLLNLVFLDVDEKIELTLDDYINETDSVLDYALSKLKNPLKR